jgi:hypothetical protein
MADTERQKLDKLYGGLQTLPKLIGDLAMSVARAQTALDQNYIESLAAFAKIVKQATGDGTNGAGDFVNIFKAVAPSRYQFTETVIEVRADLQVASVSQTELAAEVGIKKSEIFAATVNFSYLKRTASDYQAAAVIRTVLNAIPAEPGLLETLLTRGGDPPKAELRGESPLKGLKEALGDFTPDAGGDGAKGGGAKGGGGAG